jgi:hypothetical protein
MSATLQERPTMAAVGTETVRVIVFREDSAWVAHCLEYDIATQAPDLHTLRRRLELTVQVELEQSLARYGKPFAGIGPAPSYIQDKWHDDPGAFRSTGRTQAGGGKPMAVDYEMALCA